MARRARGVGPVGGRTAGGDGARGPHRRNLGHRPPRRRAGPPRPPPRRLAHGPHRVARGRVVHAAGAVHRRQERAEHHVVREARVPPHRRVAPRRRAAGEADRALTQTASSKRRWNRVSPVSSGWNAMPVIEPWVTATTRSCRVATGVTPGPYELSLIHISEPTRLGMISY